ncbi:MAG TPA: DUF3106 domain-containing protein [Bryobacteraceae bacterium]|nr:DUF3106 domain-containing protein [Bryobacteraceae bacterium]
MTRASLVALLGVALLSGGQPARKETRRLAPPPPPGPPHLIMERLSQMTEEQRDRFLGRLPADRRARLEERLQKYRELPEAERLRLQAEYDAFRQLPPERQEEMRTLFRSFGDRDEHQRRRLRRELVRLRKIPATQRAQRMQSDDFRREFSEEERSFLSRLTELLESRPVPPPPAQ